MAVFAFFVGVHVMWSVEGLKASVLDHMVHRSRTVDPKDTCRRIWLCSLCWGEGSGGSLENALLVICNPEGPAFIRQIFFSLYELKDYGRYTFFGSISM